MNEPGVYVTLLTANIWHCALLLYVEYYTYWHSCCQTFGKL